jgi:hypothetical protein
MTQSSVETVRPEVGAVRWFAVGHNNTSKGLELRPHPKEGRGRFELRIIQRDPNSGDVFLSFLNEGFGFDRADIAQLEEFVAEAKAAFG